MYRYVCGDVTVATATISWRNDYIFGCGGTKEAKWAQTEIFPSEDAWYAAHILGATRYTPQCLLLMEPFFKEHMVLPCAPRMEADT